MRIFFYFSILMSHNVKWSDYGDQKFFIYDKEKEGEWKKNRQMKRNTFKNNK